MHAALKRALVSPCCQTRLQSRDTGLVCEACDRSYEVASGVPRLRGVAQGSERESRSDEKAYRRGLRGRLRAVLPRGLISFLSPVLVTGPNPVKQVRKALEAGELVLDLGSGNDRRHPAMCNVDFLSYPEVDLVADAETLPLADESVGGLISVVMLEHVPNADAVLCELQRVLRPGAAFFLVVPFLQPFHAAPHDYARWTRSGLTEIVGRYLRVDETGVYCGPSSALVWMLAEWFALVFSLGSQRLRTTLSYFFQALFSPLKWTDFLLARLPGADAMASVLFVRGEKQGATSGGSAV